MSDGGRHHGRDGIYGVYWIPAFETLEARGFEVLLVNARHVTIVVHALVTKVIERLTNAKGRKMTASQSCGGRLKW